MDTDSKHSKLREAIKQTAGIRDRLGMPVDDNIINTVAIMNLLGFKTVMSCGGRTNRDTGGPYMHFMSAKAKEYKDDIDLIDGVKDFTNPKYKLLLDKAGFENCLEQKKLFDYLEEFYRDRATPYGQQIVVRALGQFVCRLEGQNASIMIVLEKNEKSNLLKKYQKEFRDFTDFLIEIYKS